MLTVDLAKLNLKHKDRVLDAGCGAGRHLFEAFQMKGIDVVGIDMKMEDVCKASAFLNLMKNEDSGEWITAIADVTNLPFKDESFDAVICSEVLEHIPENRTAISELVRVLKTGKNMVVSVPSFLPERICWALSDAYRNDPGGHIRIYRKKELRFLLEGAGTKCWKIAYKHALHAPYWWLKCIAGLKNENSWIVNIYKRFLEWEIMKKPYSMRILDKFLNPILAKSVVFYLRKGH